MSYPYPFVSQLHPDQTGWADCFQASLGAYLKAAGKLPSELADADVLEAVSVATRGADDAPSNPYTTLGQADVGLAHYGLPVSLTYSYQEALRAPWSICLVDGTAITKSDGTKPYPASWFDYEVGLDHFVVWGPPCDGTFNWIANPLDPARAWMQYDLSSLQRAFGCGYILPAVPGQAPVVPAKWQALRGFGLLPTPRHGATALAAVPADGTGITWGERRQVGAEVWQRVQFRDRLGWTLAGYLKAVS